MYKADLLCVAYGGAAGLSVDYYIDGLVKIRKFIDIDMTYTGAGFYAGDCRVLHTGTYQARTAARNEQIDQPGRLHDILRTAAACILDYVYNVGVAAGSGNALLKCPHNGVTAVERLLAAAEHADVAALYRKRRSVRCNVRAAFIYDCDKSERYLLFADVHAVCMHSL